MCAQYARIMSAVMTAIGNRTANSLWEHRISRPGVKPSPNSSQEENQLITLLGNQNKFTSAQLN